MSSDNGLSEKERYQRYLAGREWGLLKQQVKARSGGICERCKINPSDAVHHLTYERKYNERLEDLQDTCEACHKFTHGLSDEDPAEENLTQGFLSGIFESEDHIFFFFDTSNGDWPLPDDEVYLEKWSWTDGGIRLIQWITGETIEKPETVFWRRFLGSPFLLKIIEDENGNKTIESLKKGKEGAAPSPIRAVRYFAISVNPGSHIWPASTRAT